MKPKVVVCGSFHKNPESMQLLVEELEQTGCQILSPLTIQFKNTTDAFTRSNHDEGFSNIELERFHLRAIKQADFVWLFDPNGYMGNSAIFELGFAQALQKPVFAFESVNDPYVNAIITKVNSVFGAIKLFSALHLDIQE